ncbi:MAG: hypothetical protein ACN6NJ_10270 [Acinetobacter sp.]
MHYPFDVAFTKLRAEKIISTLDEMIDLIYQRKITICFRLVDCCIGVIYDKDKDLIKNLDHQEIQFKKDRALEVLSFLFKNKQERSTAKNISIANPIRLEGETEVDYKRIYVLKFINFESNPKFVIPHFTYMPEIYKLIMNTTHSLDITLAYDFKRKNRLYTLLTDISPDEIHDHTYPMKHGWNVLKYTPAPITIKAFKQKCNFRTSYTISKNNLLVTKESIFQLIASQKELSKQEPKDKDIARNKAREIAKRIYAIHPHLSRKEITSMVMSNMRDSYPLLYPELKSERSVGLWFKDLIPTTKGRPPKK